jgi:hypothetical protein
MCLECRDREPEAHLDDRSPGLIDHGPEEAWFPGDLGMRPSENQTKVGAKMFGSV